MVSPLCEVKDGAGAYQATDSGVDVTPSNTITIHLIDTSADTWSIACVYTDDLSDAAAVTASLSINTVLRTATFTAPAAGRAYIFRSIVNNGVGPDGRARSSYTTTFGVYTLTGDGFRVLAANETTEGGPFGWVSTVNDVIRTGGGGGATPTGNEGSVQTKDGFDLVGVGPGTAGQVLEAYDDGSGVALRMGSRFLDVLENSATGDVDPVASVDANGNPVGVIIWTGSGACNFKGIAGATPGRRLTIISASTGEHTLTLTSGASSDVNDMLLLPNDANTLELPYFTAAELVCAGDPFDLDEPCWHVVGTSAVSGDGASAPTGTGFAHVTSGSFDAAATANIRYAGGKLQTDGNVQWKNSSITGDLAWTPTSSNKTLTLPDATDTLVGRATTDTLTNKTISGSSNTISNLAASAITTGALALARGGLGLDLSAASGVPVFDSGIVIITSALDGTWVSPNFGSQDIVTTGKISLGSTPATTGLINVPYHGGSAVTILAAKDSGGTDRSIISHGSAGTTLTFGNTTHNVQVQSGGTMIVNATSAISVQTSSASRLNITTTTIQAGLPIIGMSTVYGAVDGLGTQAMADANQSPGASIQANGSIEVTGTLTATRTLTLVAPGSSGQTCVKRIINRCTGGSVTVQQSSGATVTIGPEKAAFVQLQQTVGVTRITADSSLT